MSDIKFQDVNEVYLRRRYVDDLARVQEIAGESGCSVHLVRKRLKLWKILRGKALTRAGLVRAWNEGLTKDTDPRLAKISAMHSGENNPMAGKTVWNAGLTASEDERVARVSAAMRGREVSPETRQKMADAKRGKVGEQANRWRGGTSKIGPYQEHRRTIDGRRVYVHRYVAEQCLGRLLDTSEHVHHVDRDEGNNAPSNLLVLSECDHATLHGAIYRGECDARAEQIDWLTQAGINFLELT